MSGEPPVLWLLEDDATCREIVEDAIDGSWPLQVFPTLRELRGALESTAALPALLLADVCLPDGNFLSWLRSAHGAERLAEVPIVVLSALEDVATVRTAFAGGAVDFLSKPVGRAALRVKIERVLHSAQPAERAGFELDATRMALRRRDGAEVTLTAKEMQLVASLWNAPGRRRTRAELHAEVWKGCAVGTKTLDVHLSHVRRKLASLGVNIRSGAEDELLLEVSEPG